MALGLDIATINFGFLNWNGNAGLYNVWKHFLHLLIDLHTLVDVGYYGYQYREDPTKINDPTKAAVFVGVPLSYVF